MSAIISGATQRLIARLAATALATDGAGAVGFARQTYAAGTLGARVGERVSITEFMSAAQRADAKAGAFAVDCASAFNTAHGTLQNGDVIDLPPGWMFRINSPLTFTKKIGIVSSSKGYTTLAAFGFGVDVPILTYAGTTGARIQDLELSGFRFWSDNNQATGMNLTWVNKSSFTDLYLYNLYRGYVGNNFWSNDLNNISAYGITTETVLLQDECNNLHFKRHEFRGANGLKAVGNMGGLAFDGCNFEGLTDPAGAGLLLAPTTGKKICGVTVGGSTYFENVKGNAIRAAGVDVDSVQGLTVQGNYLYGGRTTKAGFVAGDAAWAISLANVRGWRVSENHFYDWESGAIFRSGTEVDGDVTNNTGVLCTALSNSANQFAQTVNVANNFAGRRVVYVSAMPTTGNFTQGDLAINLAPVKDANSMMVSAWLRLTTGAGHVLGTDWGRAYVSHLTPAV